ncbi:MAG: flippase [Candidatus Pacebacteria bacterium]|nr:flippase [Candidatus Paceibacterota bacterium]
MSISSSLLSLKNKYLRAMEGPGFIKYLKNSGWMFVARVVSLVISFFVTTYIARYLGPYNYGQLSYAISFVALFSFISTLGIDSVLYREILRYSEKKDIYIGSALVLKLLAGLLASLLSIITAYLTGTHDVALLLIAIISFTFIFNSFNIIVFEFQAAVESKIPSIIAVVVTLILSFAKVAVVVFDKGIIYLSLVLLLESILYAGLYIVFRIKKYGSISNWSFDKNIAVSIMKDSWPMMFGSAFALVYARIDQVFIKSLVDVQSVGIYDAAVRLSEVWYFLPNILLASLFPAIMNARGTNLSTYYKRMKYVLLLMIILSFSIAIPTTFFAKEIVHIVFGPAFIGSYIILQIYIWSLAGTYINHAISYFLIAENYRKMIFTSSLVGMILNVILNILLIPRYGISGAAIATLISYTMGPLSLICYREFRYKLRLILA